VRKGAMCGALSLYVNENRLIVVEDFELADVKTRGLVDVLKKLDTNQALLVDSSENEKLKLSARNLSDCRFLPPEGLNVYDILKHDHLVITKKAILDVQERLDQSVRARKAVQ
jgi:large subunit ribosomal protein L4